MIRHKRANPIENAFLADLEFFERYGNTEAIKEASKTLLLAILDHLDAVVNAEAKQTKGVAP